MPRERKPAGSESHGDSGLSGSATRSATARLSGSYEISATDATSHMRKLEEIEAELIRMAIERYHGRMAEIARRLGIGRSTLYRKLKELGLEQPAEHSAEEDVRAAG